MKRITTKQLKQALLRAYHKQGHEYNCSAARGMESDCHCGWLEVRELVQQIEKETPSYKVK